MPNLYVGLVYLMFFLSGAAGLIYEVVWFRSLSLIFGGSHLAITTVLSVFMAGLALGSYFIGKRVGRVEKLLRFYGLLELSIAFSAGLFFLLVKFYPSLYVPLARLSPESPLYLSLVRVVLSALALIIPTTLMGGTLPLLSGLLSEKGHGIGERLSFLYGINTLGAVAGTLGAGFFLMRHFSVNLTLAFPAMINVVVGILAVILQNKVSVASHAAGSEERRLGAEGARQYAEDEIGKYRFPLRLVLWGIGVSGFCALGYEVLWTRMLILILGASIYSFTVMLAAFLTGIGLGGSAYGIVLKIIHARGNGNGSLAKAIAGFGLVQCAIGVTAVLATAFFIDLPALSFNLQQFLKSALGAGIFGAWQWTNFVVAFFYMVVPAFFMGVAFPFAGELYAVYRKEIGSAVGEIMAFNTLGAILGAALSGYALIYLVGMERALQLLSLVNIGYGVFIIASTRRNKLVNSAVLLLVLAALLLLALNPQAFRVLNPKFLAIYKSDRPDLFTSQKKAERVLNNTEVLYYGEGAESIVSSTRNRGVLTFSTNGWTEASSSFADMQCQYTLGHLPMLLNKNPKNVLVVGLGSGMTLGATTVHPGVEQITLVEIEPKVIGVAKTFAFYNHRAIDNSKVKVVFNDGRNFLLTTTDTFDVITADPIHPFFRGAGYLYTDEYFKLASEHLRPGGVMCQWLPMYRLTRENFASVVKTFSRNFKYTMAWLTVYDVELVGSNSPIIIDEAELQKRINYPSISFDLQSVMMGSADDFLGYFVMGSEGTQAFTKGAIVNTDDNLYLEFSSPFSYDSTFLEADNMASLLKHRESIIPYLADPGDPALRQRQLKKWRAAEMALPLVDNAHTLILRNRISTPEFQDLMKTLDRESPSFAPWISIRGGIGG
ncbi:MAG TPA: fused MFS/spermidine synthase [Nitrospirota bacterium]